VGLLCWGLRYCSYYSYSRKPTGHEFFVPARTLIVVFLLIVVNVPFDDKSKFYVIFVLLLYLYIGPLRGRLIARNVRELFSFNRGVLHLNEACRIDDVSRGSLSCYEILTNN
jgi:hypothetical protein